MNLKRSDLIAIICFSVLLTLVGAQSVFSFTGSTNTFSPGSIEIENINATNYYKADVAINDRLDGNYTGFGITCDWLDLDGVNRSIWPSGGGLSGVPSAYVYNIIWNGTSNTYQAYDTWGNLDEENANFVTVHNNAVNSATASGGGTILLGEFTASCTSTLIGKSDVIVYGSGYGGGVGQGTRLDLTVNDDVLYQLTGVSDAGLMYVKLVATDQTGTTLLDFDATYSIIKGVFMGASDFGMNLSKSTTTDNWVEEIYILDFGIIGMQINKAEDTFFSDINIGTSVSGGGPYACINFDEGGAGVHFDGLHIWASTTCDYGIILGAKSETYQYGAQFDNVEIEDNGLQVGVYHHENSDWNTWTNLKFKTVVTPMQIYGDYNQVIGLMSRNAGQNCIEIRGDNFLLDGGWIHASGKNGVDITSAYQTWSPLTISDVIFTSNGQDSANTYYDIMIYHTKQVQISGGSSSGTDVLYSIYVDDSDDLMIDGFCAWDELIIVDSIDADTHITDCWNGTAKFLDMDT